MKTKEFKYEWKFRLWHINENFSRFVFWKWFRVVGFFTRLKWKLQNTRRDVIKSLYHKYVQEIYIPTNTRFKEEETNIRIFTMGHFTKGGWINGSEGYLFKSTKHEN